MYCQTHNAKRLSHYHAKGFDYEICFIETPQELASLSQAFTIIGAGTNRLWLNHQDTPIVSLKDINHVQFIENGCVTVGAGVTLPTLINKAKEQRLGGLEFTWPIHASIGGALAQNFGAYGLHIGQFVRSMSVYRLADQKIISIEVNDENDWFSYRASKLKSDGLVLIEATLQLESVSTVDIQSKLTSIQEKRRSLYPLHHTCGSVFKNPPDMSAGKLLDDCGLKGFRMGPVQTATNHANIILSNPSASTQDIDVLITYLKQIVLEKTGIHLEPEIETY